MSDLISRQALLDDVTRFMDAFYNENGKMMYSDHILNEADCDNLKEWIKSFPSVNPEPKMGQWEWDSNLWCRRCSECHLSRDSKYSNYCPNCGAKMQEVEE